MRQLPQSKLFLNMFELINLRRFGDFAEPFLLYSLQKIPDLLRRNNFEWLMPLVLG